MKVWIETDDLIALLNAEKQRDALYIEVDRLSEIIKIAKVENERLRNNLSKSQEDSKRNTDRFTKEYNELVKKVSKYNVKRNPTRVVEEENEDED